MGIDRTRAVVVTVSDGVSAGIRQDGSGDAVEKLLVEHDFEVGRTTVADEVEEIVEAITEEAGKAGLILTTGGTGFGPRDVTPEATASIIEREAGGLVHAMMARGLESTALASLSRARAGEVSGSLVINLPGSPKGATESLEAIIGVLPHALQLLSGETTHH